MNKSTASLLVFIPVMLLTGCTVTETTYAPGYTNDYIVTTTYADYDDYSPYYSYYRPYNTYYSSYGIGAVGYRTGYWGGLNSGWYGGNRYYGGGVYRSGYHHGHR